MIEQPEVTTKQATPRVRGLTPKQTRAIACLLSCRTVGEAAQQAQVSDRTLYTWLDNANFLVALHAAQHEAIDAATRRLMAGNDKALDALEELRDGAKNEAVRRQAALDWLNLTLRFRGLRDDDDRLTELERRASNERKVPPKT